MNGLQHLAQYLFCLDEGEAVGQDKIEKVKSAVDKLPASDNTLISKRYSIEQDRPYTLKELAAIFGTDREWVRKKEARILRTLRRELKG